MKALKIKTNKQAMVLSAFLVIFASSVYSAPLKITLVKDVVLKRQVMAAASKVADSSAEAEEGQIVLLERDKFPNRYHLVPLKINGGGHRGCYVADVNGATFQANLILLVNLEELESCEVIASVFACNRVNLNGVAILYVKRLGFDHFSFEGTFLEISNNNSIKEIQPFSNRLSGIEKASVARKSLGCK